MRIVIESTDRIGISQEILAVFAQQAWNLKAVEIISCFTYVNVEYQALTLSLIKNCLAKVAGVITVDTINSLPSEQRENHLQALLDKIPDPIIDLDKEGKILAMNQASLSLINSDEDSKTLTYIEEYIGEPITQLIKKINLGMLSDIPSSHAITLASKGYILDVSPVFTETQSIKHEKLKQLTGSVLLVRSMNTLGRQISLMQSHQEHSFDNIIGESKSIRLIKAQGQRFAKLDLPVLISGETGTGKELIARALHESSARSKAPFLAINCSALPEHLLESELFGYASGAFTGAQKGGKPGLIELAEGGCLFLDEIAEMSPYLQAKLLRFLQDLRYRRVGGTKELQANVRIISASHQNLAKLISVKGFREDLYYRLNVLSIELPPLRERFDDINLLAHLFIENAVKQVNSSQAIKTDKLKLTAGAINLLQEFSWPGNIRQLQSVLFSVVALNNGSDIDADELREVLKRQGNNEPTLSLYNKQAIDVEQREHPFKTEECKDMFITQAQDWASAQAVFEQQLLQHFYPRYPTTRKLAERLKVSHNKIAMKLRQHQLR